eukprot:TRINITY_DN3432_c0_g1_i1.p1 TRINITY_DN3432_c0_g1~~TRINITY_DN3432_c0_g1_i1.p1  ORF type:complete len:339 (-),score=76.74 TRINITY_DN3432_c0_g1_i1:91-969(-)
MEACSEEGIVLHLSKDDDPYPFTSQRNDRQVRPDFCLIRNFPTHFHDRSWMNHLQGLMFANLPSVNSLQSIFMCMHRAALYGELRKVEKRVKESYEQRIKNGDTKAKKPFKLVPMRYYPCLSDGQLYSNLSKPTYPRVYKIGTTHAGKGKSVVKDKGQAEDLESILVLQKEFFTTEPFVEHKYEYRIQKIGEHIRVFKRKSEGNWKANVGNLEFEAMVLEDYHKEWAEEFSKVYGGLDILGIDVLVQEDGTEVVLELNDSATGIVFEFSDEDTKHLRDLVIKRMNEHFRDQK